MALLLKRVLQRLFLRDRGPKQLRMTYRFNGTENLPSLFLPDGFQIKSYTIGSRNEEDAWVALLSACEFAGFSPASGPAVLEQEILRGLLPGGGIFISKNDHLVACAAGCFRPEFAPDAVLMYVAVLPEYRRNRLGTAAVLGVLDVARKAGFPGLTLLTDETRIPAIRAYLRLGFLPDEIPCRKTLPRWKPILKEIPLANTSHISRDNMQ
jgi:mycothiol synthase